MNSSAQDTPSVMTPAKAAIGVVVIIAGVALYLTVAYGLNVEHYYMGFLFSLYFSAFEKSAPAMFVPSLLGALTGIANASAFALLPELLGIAPGLALALILTAAAMFCLLMGWLRIAINSGYLLFVTVASIPALQHPKPFLGMAAGVLLGAAFMGIILLIGRLSAQRKAG